MEPGTLSSQERWKIHPPFTANPTSRLRRRLTARLGRSLLGNVRTTSFPADELRCPLHPSCHLFTASSEVCLLQREKQKGPLGSRTIHVGKTCPTVPSSAFSFPVVVDLNQGSTSSGRRSRSSTAGYFCHLSLPWNRRRRNGLRTCCFSASSWCETYHRMN